MEFECFFACSKESQPRRNHKPFLRAGNEHINPPFVHFAVNCADTCYAVNNRNSAMFFYNCGKLFQRVCDAGCGFVVRKGYDFYFFVDIGVEFCPQIGRIDCLTGLNLDFFNHSTARSCDFGPSCAEVADY